ncbi:MAG: LysR family transcriptional regulator [Caulobacteraceae bacterium]
MLDSRRLEIYCAVAEEGSFTAAALRLHLTQSAVSQQIAILERDVGITLMERVARGVKLTPAGQFLAKRARALLRDMAALEQDLHRQADPPRKVTLGVFATAGAHLVPILVRKYRERYPETQLVLQGSQPEDLAAELVAGKIDVGISWDYDFLMRPLGDLHRRHLLTDPMYLLLPREHPLAGETGPIQLADMADEAWVVRTHRSPRYEDAFEVMCRIAGFEPRIAFRTEDYQSVQGLVAASVGVAVAPRLSIRAQRPDIAVRPIHAPTFARRIEAITLPGSHANPLAQQLLELLEELQALGGWD